MADSRPMLANRSAWRPAYAQRRHQLGLAPLFGIPFLWSALGLLSLGGAIYGTSEIVKGIIPEEARPEWKRLPTVFAFAGGGTAALMGAPLLPKEIQPLAYVLGVAGISIGGYYFFSSPEVGVSDKVPSGLEVPPLPLGSINEKLKIIFRPEQLSSGGSSRVFWLDQEYIFTIQNRSNEDYEFFAGIAMYDSTGRIWESYRDLTTYGRKKIFVGNDSITEEQELIIPSSGVAGRGPFRTVEIQLFRALTDREYFARSEGIPITVSAIS